MRLFIALDIEQSISDRIARFVDEVRVLAPTVRWVSAASLHVTLKFIGERPDGAVGEIEHAIGSVFAKAFELSFRGTGFFPNETSARVFWGGIEAAAALSELAGQIERALVPLGIEAEGRAFNPHLTLARAGSDSGSPGQQRKDKPNRTFSALQEKLSAIPAPDFGTMKAAEFFLYRSQLSSRGAQYSKIASFALDN